MKSRVPAIRTACPALRRRRAILSLADVPVEWLNAKIPLTLFAMVSWKLSQRAVAAPPIESEAVSNVNGSVGEPGNVGAVAAIMPGDRAIQLTLARKSWLGARASTS